MWMAGTAFPVEQISSPWLLLRTSCLSYSLRRKLLAGAVVDDRVVMSGKAGLLLQDTSSDPKQGYGDERAGGTYCNTFNQAHLVDRGWPTSCVSSSSALLLRSSSLSRQLKGSWTTHSTPFIIPLKPDRMSIGVFNYQQQSLNPTQVVVGRDGLVGGLRVVLYPSAPEPVRKAPFPTMEQP